MIRDFFFKGASRLVAALAVSLVFGPRTAHAGNLDAFYVSAEAALQAGAVTATSSTGGSIWYNPAGLSQLSGTRVDVNVSAYTARFGANVGFDSSVEGTVENRLNLLAVDVVPAAFTIARRFGKVGLGLGVFVPVQNSVVLRTHLEAPAGPDGEPPLEFGYDSSSNTREYHLGPGIGWDPLRRLSIGASLLANYRTQFEATDVAATAAGPSGRASFSTHRSRESLGVGLELVLGAKWKLDDGWRLGAVVRTPSLRLGQAGKQIETELRVSPDGQAGQDIVFDETLSLGTQVLSPFRFHAGVSKEFERLRGALDLSLLLPYRNELFGIVERATWNARLGAQTELNPNWSVGGGLFTDRSFKEKPSDFLDKQIDFYGVTVAVDWMSSYGVYSKGKRQVAPPRALLFGTTISLSYGLGLGTIAGALVGPGMDGVDLRAHTSEVVAHEFSLHIASTLAE